MNSVILSEAYVSGVEGPAFAHIDPNRTARSLWNED